MRLSRRSVVACVTKKKNFDADQRASVHCKSDVSSLRRNPEQAEHLCRRRGSRDGHDRFLGV